MMSTGPAQVGPDATRVFVYREVVDRRAVRKVPGRRRMLRYKYSQPCVIQASRGNFEVSLHATCQDLSEISMGVRISADLLPGEIVSVELPLDAYNETLVTHAIVRRRDAYVYGLEFIDLEPDQRLTLRMHLHSSPGKPLSANIPPWL
jgi:hypothetical protein